MERARALTQKDEKSESENRKRRNEKYEYVK